MLAKTAAVAAGPPNSHMNSNRRRATRTRYHISVEYVDKDASTTATRIEGCKHKV